MCASLLPVAGSACRSACMSWRRRWQRPSRRRQALATSWLRYRRRSRACRPAWRASKRLRRRWECSWRRCAWKCSFMLQGACQCCWLHNGELRPAQWYDVSNRRQLAICAILAGPRAVGGPALPADCGAGPEGVTAAGAQGRAEPGEAAPTSEPQAPTAQLRDGIVLTPRGASVTADCNASCASQLV